MSWKVAGGAGLTLNAAAQRLSDIYGAGTPVGGAADISYSQVFLQPDGGNANPIFIGDDNTVSSTNYGMRLEKASAGVPPAPFTLGPFEAGGVKLSQIWVIGTNTEKLRVVGVPA